MEYILGELERIQNFVNVPLMTRRLEIHKDDPMDELMDVYEGVKEIEDQLSKTINIATSAVQKHHKLYEECVDMQDELEDI